MNLKELQVLKVLNLNESISQREVAEYTGFALGTINNIIKKLEEDEYIKRKKLKQITHYEILNKGIEEIKKNSIKLAVILAAGLGSRLDDVTKGKMPKGFLKIEEKSLIERSINNLFKNGIENIIIVTGHLCNHYEELCKKYNNIRTVKNENYANTGSMASLAVAEGSINEDFLLLESDLIYEEKAIERLQYTDKKDCVLLSGKTNSGDEVYVEVRDNNIYKVSKDAHGLNSIYGEWVGIVKVSKDLLNRMMVEYSKNTNLQYHYEYAIEDAAKNYVIGYEKIDNLVWAEIDNNEHLKRVMGIIIPKINKNNTI